MRLLRAGFLVFAVGCGRRNDAVPGSEIATDSAPLDAVVTTDDAPVTDGAASDDSSNADDAADGSQDANGGTSPWQGRWLPVPGAYPECGPMVAADPAIWPGPLKWKPCASGRAGCRTLDTDWSTAVERLALLPDAARIVHGQPYFAYQRRWVGADPYKPPPYWLSIVQPLDGAPSVAVRTDETSIGSNGMVKGCLMTPFVGEAGAGFVGILGTDDTRQDSEFLMWSSFGAPMALTGAFQPANTLGLQGAQNITFAAVGASSFFLTTLSPAAIVVFSLDKKAAVGSRPLAETVVPAHGGGFALSFSATPGVVFIGEDGTSALVASPEKPRAITYVTVDRSDGDALYWVESDDNFAFQRATLWTSPYATSAAGLVRRRVTLLGEAPGPGWGGQGLVANGGMTLSYVSDTSLRLTRVSDGAGWIIATEPGDGVYLPLWVDDTEVWFVTRDARWHLGAYGITRIRRDSLGAPTVSAN